MKGLLVATLAVAVSCDRPGSRAAPSDFSASSVDTTALTRGPDSANPDSAREIYIDNVSGDNPLVVRGRARTFENTVQVRVRDVRGEEVDEVFTTSVGEMGHHNPYEARAWIVRDPGPRVTVEAFEYSAMDGSVRSLTSVVVPYPVARVDVTLMLPVSDDCTTTAAFTRRVPKTVAVARLLAEALVAGPDSAERAAGAVSPFPKGSEVRSVVLRDGVLTVDFSERLQNVGGACAATAIRRSVTGTMERLPGVKRVIITAGRSEALALQP